MRRKRTLLSLTIAVGMIAAGCSDVTRTTEPLPSGTAPQPLATQAVGSLVQFDACDDFLDYVIEHALEFVGPYGLEGFNPWPWVARDGMAAGEDDSGGAPTDARSEFSETNVQVEGVDEPDIVKTDGERIVLINEGELIVVDATGEEPLVTGRLAMGELSVQSLFLSGDVVLVFGSVWNQGPVPLAEADVAFGPVTGSPVVEIVEVADPEDDDHRRKLDLGSDGRRLGPARSHVRAGRVRMELPRGNWPPCRAGSHREESAGREGVDGGELDPLLLRDRLGR